MSPVLSFFKYNVLGKFITECISGISSKITANTLIVPLFIRRVWCRFARYRTFENCSPSDSQRGDNMPREVTTVIGQDYNNV